MPGGTAREPATAAPEGDPDHRAACAASRPSCPPTAPPTGASGRPERRPSADLDRLERPLDEGSLPRHVTASAIVVGRRGVLLHRHRRLGTWMQPGGHLDAGEEPPEAALRECREETGLAAAHPGGEPRLVHLDVHAAADGHEHIDLRYLVVGPDAPPAPPPGESQEVAWVSWDEADALADEALAGGLRTARSLVERRRGGRSRWGTGRDRAVRQPAWPSRATTRPSTSCATAPGPCRSEPSSKTWPPARPQRRVRAGRSGRAGRRAWPAARGPSRSRSPPPPRVVTSSSGACAPAPASRPATCRPWTRRSTSWPVDSAPSRSRSSPSLEEQEPLDAALAAQRAATEALVEEAARSGGRHRRRRGQHPGRDRGRAVEADGAGRHHPRGPAAVGTSRSASARAGLGRRRSSATGATGAISSSPPSTSTASGGCPPTRWSSAPSATASWSADRRSCPAPPGTVAAAGPC